MADNDNVWQALPGNGLCFSEITPVAPRGLGLLRNHISNGRLFATVGWHGGLTHVSYCGTQHLRALRFFETGLETGWMKLFRTALQVGTKLFYPPLRNTRLYPFGFSSDSDVAGVQFKQEILLLSDAIVQRYIISRNTSKVPVGVEMLHHEIFSRAKIQDREWKSLEFDPRLNAMIGSVVDQNKEVYTGEGDSLSQQNLGLVIKDAPSATTWIGIGCTVPISTRTSYNDCKVYLTSKPGKYKIVSLFVVFATSKPDLEQRLKALSANVNRECESLLAGYDKRLAERPRIDVGDPVLNSAFGQYPESLEFLKIPDRPGAVRAGIERSFVWGWDGMTPLMSSPLANEADYSASILRFFQEGWNPVIGLPLLFTTAFEARIRSPFPAQAQYIAGLYHYFAITGDLKVVREMMPTCKRILERCRERVVKDTGLVAGNALWPDFPECMGENGEDIAAINNSTFYQGLRCVEYFADALGDRELAADCRDWARKLRENFIKYLYDEEKGYFITSCSSRDFSPRKHYGCQVIFWVTPFANELVSHAPGRIASFMNEHLRSARCLLSLPRWDTAWMAEGNQLGGSYPMADHFYINVNKLVGEGSALKAWMGDVRWNWRYHTAPEALTPEAENEHIFGPDNHGGKQAQACSTWYTCLYKGLAGLDFDHEGLTITPWGDTPVDIRGLRLRGVSVDVKVSGAGTHVKSLKLNGKALPAGSRKILWDQFTGKTAKIELVRGNKAPRHPVIVRADGWRVSDVITRPSRLVARIEGRMSGEIAIQALPKASVLINGDRVRAPFERATGTVLVSLDAGAVTIEVVQPKAASQRTARDGK